MPDWDKHSPQLRVTLTQMLVAEPDAVLPAAEEPDGDQLAAIMDLCAWAHSEWVRIHPFANGNGRTARLWANSLAMRYGLPPFIRLRPRPNASYGQAGAKAMQGDWKPTAAVFRRLLEDFLADHSFRRAAHKDQHGGTRLSLIIAVASHVNHHGTG